VLIAEDLPYKEAFIQKLIQQLKEFNVEILGDDELSKFENVKAFEGDAVWFEEFLDYKIVLGSVVTMQDAINKINTYGGGHSAVIVTKNNDTAQQFMESVDSAAVYQNASTRFTDGGQFGLGGELAISTDKLHHRGPMGLHHLVTNKWYVFGDGQIR
jgi:glutamate-5-semialdehyde dehydrogenase